MQILYELGGLLAGPKNFLQQNRPGQAANFWPTQARSIKISQTYITVFSPEIS